MNNEMLLNPAVTLEDIVYENRNKEYGSFVLRKKNRKFLFLAFLISLIGLGSGISVPFIKAYRDRGKKIVLLTTTVVSMTDVKAEDDIPPPPPPPPPPAAAEQQVKYTAPVVVDTVKEEVQLATVSEVSQTTTNEPVPEKIEVAKEEENAIQEEEPVFIFVEEQASFQGGDVTTFRSWVEKNLVYPPVASENGIFGKVIVQFAVNSKGEVVDVKVLRSVDQSLDKETIRVIMSSPKWTPAKQGGRAVKQQFVIPISFVLQ
jgi:periplasmic protein TonB